MNFSDHLRCVADPLWRKEREHPFVRGIGTGNLPFKCFQYYMKQDYLFLIDFSRVIALASSRSSGVSDMAWFAGFLNDTINTEMSLHIGFCSDFDITQRDLEDTKPSPSTLAYTRHLLQIGYTGSIGDITAALLPCSWGYSEIGKMLHKQGLPTENPLYCKWITMYSDVEFAELAKWLRGFIDRIAMDSMPQELDRMEEIFLLSSQYEYMFWDAAYRLEQWPI